MRNKEITIIVILTVLIISLLGNIYLFKKVDNANKQASTTAVELLNTKDKLQQSTELVEELGTVLNEVQGIKRVSVCKITYYCSCMKCCGKTNGITASGTNAKAGRTVAADPEIFPYGTQLFIEGLGWRTVEDTGGAVQPYQLDVFMDSHEEALKQGVRTAIVVEKET